MKVVETLPHVSVVVCAFNEEALIHSCLTGLSRQTYPAGNYEILVIENESTDSTYKIVEEFIRSVSENAPQLTLVQKRHGGLSESRNLGVDLSQGSLIAFIDADAIPEPDWLEQLVAAFHNDADYVGGRIELLNTESWVARFLQETRHRQFFGPRIFYNHFVGCNMAFRRKVFESGYGFFETFTSLGDESALLESIGDRFQYSPAPRAVVLHERPTSILASLRADWRSAKLACLVKRVSNEDIVVAAGRVQWAIIVPRVEQLLILFFPPSIVLFFVSPSLFGPFLIISSLAVIRRLYLRPLNQRRMTGLVARYGIVRGTIGHVLFGLMENITFFSGLLIGCLIHRRTPIIPPRTSQPTITSRVDSRGSSAR